MANSKYEHSRGFETLDILPLFTWIVIRIDGRGFHRFSACHNFTKPNDTRALKLMNAAATAVVTELPDICLAYGMSDEYSFVLHRETSLFERRQNKLVSTVVSTFTAEYVYRWREFMGTDLRGENGIGTLPTFDGRAVTYPTRGKLRDYLSWRQVDCHINNLYNTCFWALVHGGLTVTEAAKELQGKNRADKNEILFSRFGINYNNELELFKKGSVVFREVKLPEKTHILRDNAADGAADAEERPPVKLSKSQLQKQKKKRRKAMVVVRNVDIIQDLFWEERPWILAER